MVQIYLIILLSMFKNWKLIALFILLVLGAILIAYLFAKESIQNLGETITGDEVGIPVEGEPTQETLLSSLLDSAIDFDGQMERIRTEGFENEYFIATLNKIDSFQKLFTLGMEFKVNGTTKTEEKIATVNCPVDSTTVLGSENMELLTEKADIFKWAVKGNSLISYCLDSECSSVGKECILIKTSE